MAVELFANQATTTVSSGGTTAPAQGTTEMWTVASSAGFPAADSDGAPPTQFHVADVAAGKTGELILVTDVSGTTWTVTRGAESTTTVTHSAGFTVYQVVSAGAFAQLFAVDWLNVVTMFGADNTGTNDAGPAIQNALTAGAGAAVYIPAGTYKIATKPSVSSNTLVTGDGWGTHLIMGAAANLNGLLEIGGTTGVTIANMQLDGNNAHQSAAAVSLISGSNVTEATVTGVWAHNSAQQGIYWGNANECTISNCYATSNGISEGFGFGFNESSPGNAATASWGNKITGCYAEGNTEGGYSLFGGAYNSATYDCQIVGCTADSEVLGFNIYSGYKNLIIGCKAIACTTAGVQLEHGAWGNSFSENSVDGAGVGTEGINLAGSSTVGPLRDNTITGNTVTGVGSIGIFATYCNGGAITGNTAQGNGNRGIHLTLVNGVTVTGNNARGNGQDGIRLDGCTACTVSGNIAQNNSQNSVGGFNGIQLNDTGGTGTTYCAVTGNNCSDTQPAMGGALTANASSGQPQVTVSTATAYSLFANQWVTIGDVTDGTENNQISTINTSTGVLTMANNLANSYTTANSATVTGRATQKWGINENSALENFNSVTGNILQGNRTGTANLLGASDVYGLNVGY